MIMDIGQLSKLPILMRLTEDILGHVAERGSLEKLAAGQDVCRENTPAEAVIWVLSGRLKTSVQTGEKEETVIDILSKESKARTGRNLRGRELLRFSRKQLKKPLFFV